MSFSFSELQNAYIDHLITQGETAEQATDSLLRYRFGVAYPDGAGGFTLLSEERDGGGSLPCLFLTYEEAAIAHAENDAEGLIALVRWNCFDDVEAYQVTPDNKTPDDDCWIGQTSMFIAVS